MNTVTRIVAVIVDTVNLTVYTDKGECILIKQGTIDATKVLSEAMIAISQQGFADVVLSPEINNYQNFEDLSEGTIKLFRVNKGMLVPLSQDNLEPSELLGLIQEITTMATSVKSPSFTKEGIYKQGNIEDNGYTDNQTPELTEESTIVAIVNDETIVPGIEHIESHLTHAVSLNSAMGIENFLKRAGTMVGKRNHSVNELFRFIERGDLPIADDGSIIIYKVLNDAKEEGKYVDCHTGKVIQWVGAYVCMDEALVDMDRRKECSTGLHVARRGYVKSFSGNKCVLAKINPEDVIAVPMNEGNKMRVCGYHIIAELSSNMLNLVRSNKPMTSDEEARKLLAKVVTGDHIGITHEIRIGGPKGEKVTVKEITTTAPTPVRKVASIKALPNANEVKQFPVLEPKALLDKLSNKKAIQELLEDLTPDSVKQILIIKSRAKKSWDALGVSPEDVQRILTM